MCFPRERTAIIDWLTQQVRVIENWREEVAISGEMDIPAITAMERHYQWLTGELARLRAACTEQADMRLVAAE